MTKCNVKDVDDEAKPRYLEALTENNLPREDWGPLQGDNRYGEYRRVNGAASITEIDFDLTRASVVARLDSQHFEADLSE